MNAVQTEMLKLKILSQLQETQWCLVTSTGTVGRRSTVNTRRVQDEVIKNICEKLPKESL